MKSVKSLFALFTIVALSFACAPVAEQATPQATANQPEISTEQPAFPWTDQDASCCEQKPIYEKPKI